MKHKRSSERVSQELEHSRATQKSSTAIVALRECVLCGEKEGFAKNAKKAETVSEITRSRGNVIQVFRVLMCSMSSL